MPIPFRGLVAVAEYGSKFDADVAVGALEAAGIAATASYDPALNSVASFMASDRTVEVVVAQADLDAARRVLADRQRPLPDAFGDEAMGEWPSRVARRPGRSALRVTATILVCLFFGLPLAFMVVTLLTRLA